MNKHLGAVLIWFALLATPAHAQVTIVPPDIPTSDANGVNLVAPDISIYDPELTIGPAGAGGLTFKRKRDARQYVRTAFDTNPEYCIGPGQSNWGIYLRTKNNARLVITQESVDRFSTSGSPPLVLGSYKGSSLTYPLGADPFYIAPDGTKTTFGTSAAGSYYSCDFPYQPPPGGQEVTEYVVGNTGSVSTITRPDGQIDTYNYAGGLLRSITNNLGYMLHFEYDPTTAMLTKVTGINRDVYACSPTATTCDPNGGGVAWPYLVYANVSGGLTQTVTDRTGVVTTFEYINDAGVGSHCAGSPTDPTYAAYCRTLVKIRRGSGVAANDTTVMELGLPDIGLVSPVVGGAEGILAVINAKGQTTYDYAARQTHVSQTSGYAAVYNFSTTNLLTQATLNGRTSSYQWDTPGFRVLRVDRPDGDYSIYEYDNRTNIVHSRNVPKAGSGLSEIHQYASYPEAAVVMCANAKTCNKPLWVTMPGASSATPSSLPKTDITYDSGHGGVLTETKPAPGSGPYASIRPETRYTYDATGGVARVATVKSCLTTATCAGGADEVVVENTYNAKRLPSLAVSRAGNNTTAYTATNSRTATTYSPQGDVESVDGPLSGAADTSWSYYDVMRRPRTAVAPDPDGAGALVYRATRTTYSADGNPIMTEQGSVSAPSNCSPANSFCAATLTVLAKSTTGYDTYGRTIRSDVINPATSASLAVTQQSYDNYGRVDCVATRMNAAAYGSLPAACTQSTMDVAFGPDQITRTTYTVNNDPSVIQTGYGTGVVRNERTFTYLAAGQVATLKDAANNLTTYEYDGFNRLRKLRYPVTTTGGNASSTTDYEQYGYDAAGNKTSERRRDGLTIANTYDVLNRLRLIDKPGAELDVTNSYDNVSNLITASQTGSSVTWAYDALGRVTSEAQGLGTVSYTYDTAGRRTQLTWPGAGFYANYQYFDDGRLKLLGLNGATTGSGVLATYYDDQLGRRTSMCRGTGTTSSCASVARTAYSYDAISRLSGLSHDLVTGGSTNDASWTLAYSPASQLVSRSASSALYEWPYASAFSDTYVVNGLNQYTTVAGAALAYDGRGNTTNDTTKTYTYDSSNMLMSASNGAALTYDPTGRLLSIAQGGVTTKFLYDGTRLIAEYNGANTLLRRYVHGDGVDDPIVWYDSAGTTNKRDLFKDERGSVIAADTGAAVSYMRYDEYGNPGGTYTGRFQYTGQTWLPEIAQYYYKARIYNPDLGRFMQTDPIGTNDQMNLYAYVGNDPFNGVDPSGTRCVPANANSVYCLRRDIYRVYDTMVSDKTSFFKAASLTVEYLANGDIPILANIFMSDKARNFLQSSSSRLYSANAAALQKILSGELSGPALDRKMVHMEQSIIQSMLDALPPEERASIVGSINFSFSWRSIADTLSDEDTAYNGVLSQVEGDLGRPIDFGRQSDREAIGNALIDSINTKRRCKPADSRIYRPC